MSLSNPYKHITSKSRENLFSLLGVGTFLGIWSAVSLTGLMPANLLPPPWEIVEALIRLFRERSLADQMFLSGARVFAAVLLSAAIGIPVGIAFGTSRIFEAMFARPLVYPLKATPLIAILPICTLWFGIGELMKVLFLTIGAVVFVIPLTAEAIRSVPKPYYVTAEDIGATAWERMRTVLLPIAAPEIFNSIIVANSICWTYIVAAEVTNSQSGLGFSIMVHRRTGDMAGVWAVLLVILFFAFGADAALKGIRKINYPWYRA